MFWGAGILKFARPIRWITIVIDNKVVDGQVFNFKISGHSRGHCVLGGNRIEISSAEQYPQLLEKNKVIVDRNLRKKNYNQTNSENCRSHNVSSCKSRTFNRRGGRFGGVA